MRKKEIGRNKLTNEVNEHGGNRAAALRNQCSPGLSKTRTAAFSRAINADAFDMRRSRVSGATPDMTPVYSSVSKRLHSALDCKQRKRVNKP